MANKRQTKEYEWQVKMINEDRGACIQHAETFYRYKIWKVKKIDDMWRLFVQSLVTSVIYDRGRFKTIMHRH